MSGGEAFDSLFCPGGLPPSCHVPGVCPGGMVEDEIDSHMIIYCEELQTITLKMADQGRSDFYVGFTMSLCPLGLKQLLISLLFQMIRL